MTTFASSSFFVLSFPAMIIDPLASLFLLATIVDPLHQTCAIARMACYYALKASFICVISFPQYVFHCYAPHLEEPRNVWFYSVVLHLWGLLIVAVFNHGPGVKL